MIRGGGGDWLFSVVVFYGSPDLYIFSRFIKVLYIKSCKFASLFEWIIYEINDFRKRYFTGYSCYCV